MIPENFSQVASNKKGKMLREEPTLYVKTPPIDLAQLIFMIFISRITTYKDEKCTKVQTEGGKRRSIEDLYMVSRTYFPKISYLKLEERVQALYQENLPVGSKIFLTHALCGQVLREVHHPGNLKFTEEWVRENLPDNLEIKKK